MDLHLHNIDCEYLEEGDREEAPLRDALRRLERLSGPEDVPDVYSGALLRVPQPHLLPPAARNGAFIIIQQDRRILILTSKLDQIFGQVKHSLDRIYHRGLLQI